MHDRLWIQQQCRAFSGHIICYGATEVTIEVPYKAENACNFTMYCIVHTLILP